MKTKASLNLKKHLDGFANYRVLVLGDIMLDEYLWGKVQRISPEAPVPVIELNHEEYRLGGAANVALNLAALGAKVELVGVCGKDMQAKTVKKLLQKQKISTDGIFGDEDRPTTLKTRIGAVSQQIVRLDREDTTEVRDDLRKEIESYLEKLIPNCDALIIEDYDKGLLSKDMIKNVLTLAQKHKVPVAVDPKKKHFDLYTGIDIFKPNYGEIQDYLGKHYSDTNGFFAAATELQNKMKCKHLVITWGSKGLFVITEGGKPQHIPSFAKEVFDVSGAGDTVISALSLAYLDSRDILSAALIANHAAAVVVAKHGTATANCKEIWDSLSEQ
ncbi:MAG: D-glycero-beta-D-manno-heptose-7-phosphate kinase [Candidatus Cloacimonetes bacterium HGW-Cloacimonetes-3]|jgi:D-beta-D-heptose 7-phosphate kinase/D-beta-D-heptose 1-phosphate adenosyltransferase|nr:MAG: D-glycero-beta-D-manno-heptose-7-phosphate kinase [Candidatus Cloacimonetes bacterium HGW-Cloacimonetes-3]